MILFKKLNKNSRSRGNYNRVKVSLTLLCSRLLCSYGLKVNSFCLGLHTDMLIITGILLVACGDREVFFIKDLQESCEETHSN